MRVFAIGVLVCALVAAAAAFGAKHGGVLQAAARPESSPVGPAPESIPTTRAALEAKFGTPVTISNTSEGECWNYGKNHSTAPDSLQVCFRSDGGTSFSYSTHETATSGDDVIGFTLPDR